jgi:transcription initiation factor TFIIIB Brf1 subunit/transcription initiation factor TFIIB
MISENIHDISEQSFMMSKPIFVNNRSKKTQKKKKNLSNLDKSKLWEAYDQEKKLLKTIDESEIETNILPTNDNCNRCHSVNIFNEDGFPTCSNTQCGVMNCNVLDYSPEWRFFASDDRHANDPTRCGNPIDPLLEQSSYACKVLCGNVSSTEMKNLRKWTKWQSMPPQEKALYDEFQIITILAQNSGIPKIIIDYAKTIYKDFYEQQTFRGMNREATRAGSIWIACWKNGCPRTSNEISEIFKIDKNSASLGCSRAEEMLRSSERTLIASDKSQLCMIQPIVFIERFCSKLKMPDELIMLAMFIARQVESQNLIPDNRPQAIAVGIIYFISEKCNLKYTKMYIKHILDDEVSEVTINKCYQKLDKLKEKLLPSWVFQKYIDPISISKT